MTAAFDWICCHLGAREHYAVPRALRRIGRLRRMITDAWVPPDSAWSKLPGAAAQRLAERWHDDLADVQVDHFTSAVIARESLWRSLPDGWPRLIKRNQWFGKRAAAALEATPAGVGIGTVFAHSYSAREAFRVAKARGFTTVLGQIDSGPEHFRIAQRAATERPAYGEPPVLPPASYFESWREECRLADWIVVNSEWSRELLERAGIAPQKLRVVPLAFTPSADAQAAARVYPDRFTAGRPLRLLFVGHVSVVKGAAALLEAVELLGDVPVELRVVGAVAMRIPQRFTSHPAIQWAGAVSRSEVMRQYRAADVLVFPSLSDGFGMAQIEAQGWQLPVVASRSCGRVVDDGVNGLLLPEPTPDAIAAAVRRLACDPELLQRFSEAATSHGGGLPALAAALVALDPA